MRPRHGSRKRKREDQFDLSSRRIPTGIRPHLGPLWQDIKSHMENSTNSFLQKHQKYVFIDTEFSHDFLDRCLLHEVTLLDIQGNIIFDVMIGWQESVRQFPESHHETQFKGLDLNGKSGWLRLLAVPTVPELRLCSRCMQRCRS